MVRSPRLITRDAVRGWCRRPAMASAEKTQPPIVVAAIVLPFAIETTQQLVLWLDRACESADVVDNLTGLAIGLAGGVVVRRLIDGVDPRRR